MVDLRVVHGHWLIHGLQNILGNMSLLLEIIADDPPLFRLVYHLRENEIKYKRIDKRFSFEYHVYRMLWTRVQSFVRTANLFHCICILGKAINLGTVHDWNHTSQPKNTAYWLPPIDYLADKCIQSDSSWLVINEQRHLTQGCPQLFLRGSQTPEPLHCPAPDISILGSFLHNSNLNTNHIVLLLCIELTEGLTWTTSPFWILSSWLFLATKS